MAPLARKLPEGYSVGTRVVTNARYAACYVRSPKRRLGTIVGPSKSTDGNVYVKLDDHKYPKPMDLRLFDIVGDTKAGGE